MVKWSDYKKRIHTIDKVDNTEFHAYGRVMKAGYIVMYKFIECFTPSLTDKDD